MSDLDGSAGVILNRWDELKLVEKFRESSGGGRLTIRESGIKNLKNSFKSSIWHLSPRLDGKTVPIILKEFKHDALDRTESKAELNIYRKADRVLKGYMPDIYSIESGVHENDIWVFLEYVQPVEDQVAYQPKHFDKIIPALAGIHGATYHYQFAEYGRFKDWLPHYTSAEELKERRKLKELTGYYLEEAMKRPDLQEKLAPYHALLHRLLEKGPNFFPELVEAGLSLVHSDLQAPNIGSNHIQEDDWKVKLLDWEGARYNPCWYDMVSLVGVYLSYRDDWHVYEEEIVYHCSRLYAKCMRKQGVVFRERAQTLFKMAYLQQILEKNLYLQLMWEVNGIKKGYLIDGYLKKIVEWGNELGLR